MQDDSVSMYDIGDLKNDPERLYVMAVKFSQVFEMRSEHQTAEIWLVLERVSHSLWGNLPPVIVLDFRDPDDHQTWGKYGAPPSTPQNTSADNLPNLYSVADIATLFGVSKSTVSRWFKRGLLPCVRIGGRRYVEYSDLMVAINQGKVTQPIFGNRTTA